MITARDRRLIRKLLLIVLFLVQSVLFIGCWSYREIDEINIVGGMGVDYNVENGLYMISAEVVSHSQTGEEEGVIFHIEDETVFSGIRSIIKKSGKKLYWGHARIIAAGETVARSGLMPAVDMIYRDAELRDDMRLLVCEGSDVASILKSEFELHNMGSYYIAKIIENNKYVSTYFKSSLWEFIKKDREEGTEPILPLVKKVKKNGREYIVVEGSAIFKGDRMTGKLNSSETKDYLLITDKLKGALKTVDVPFTDKSHNVSLKVHNSSAVIRVFKNENIPMIKVNVDIDAEMAEVDSTMDYTRKIIRNRLEKHIETSIEKDLDKLIEKIQKEYNSDIFGFGKRVMEQMPSYWKEKGSDWDMIFPVIDIKPDVKLNIKDSGLFYKPLKIAD